MHYSPAPLHIPDGFLNISVSLVCWALTVITLSVAVSRTNRSLGEKQVPLMGIMASFIFAAQMINFPVAGGTSGHLLGGALAAIVLGPWAGMLVMTAVVAVQGLLFQDGGLLAMGANILNMGLLTVAIGYGLYRSVLNKSQATRLTVAGIAAWLSVMAGALATSLQLWLSGTSNLQTVVIAMLGVHAVIGLGEALVTVAALGFILRTRPDLLGEGSASAEGGRGWVVAGIVVSLLVVLLSPFASADPDGLNRVAIDLGFIHVGQSSSYQIIPDYTLPFLGATPLSTILAGAIGIVVVGVIIFLLGQGLKTKS
ncbi:MAG: cobalamin biosynthesis protein CbiM [Anaerolineales bacterium]|nr:cobalamin biosynthesis protein CbiM [Anaerolineae bacterium]PWB77325.1 MAG: cobalamin biosynthesis protein CbiM [Anaerolineales bacterium]